MTVRMFGQLADKKVQHEISSVDSQNSVDAKEKLILRHLHIFPSRAGTTYQGNSQLKSAGG